jgi:hypothetical protein
MSISKFSDCFRATFYLTGTVFFVLNVWQLAIWFNWLWQMRSLINGASPVT